MEILLKNKNLKVLEPYDDEEQKLQDEKLLQPFTYVAQFTDGTIRSKLVKAFNHWLDIPAEQTEMIENIVEIFHNTSFLLDDIGDNSLRIGSAPSAHSIYGTPLTINAATHTICVACQIVKRWCQQANRIFLEQIMEFLRGQGIELHWRYNNTWPAEEEYNEMARKKMGALYMLMVRLMQLFSANKEDFTKLISILSLSLQIIDDIDNCNAKKDLKEKSCHGDLTEWRFNFPIIYAINSPPAMLRQDAKDHTMKDNFAPLLEKYGSFEYTTKKLKELREEAIQEIEKFVPNPYMETAINYIFKDIL